MLNAKVSASKEDLIRLEYSQSAFSEIPIKQMVNFHNPKNHGTDELTSLELLTIKSPVNEDYHTPMKDPEPRHKESASEPVLVREQELKEVKEEVPFTESKTPFKN